MNGDYDEKLGAEFEAWLDALRREWEATIADELWAAECRRKEAQCG